MDLSRIIVRVAMAADASLLAELGRRTFFHSFSADNTDADMSAYLGAAFSPEIQAEELADPASTFLIAEIDGVAAGYARLRSGDAPTDVQGIVPLEIVRFYADRPWIGAGVGQVLMAECLNMAAALPGCDAVWLAVWERNLRAIAFYSKSGFVAVGEQEFVVGSDIQHDLVMARPPEPSEGILSCRDAGGSHPAR